MLKFNVRNQSISRIDNFRPAEKSIKYLLAQFDFKTDDWEDTVKTAVFCNTKTGKPYDAILDGNMCVVPWEALSESGLCEVSVYGIKSDGSRITTDKDVFNLKSTIYGGSATQEPSPTVYEQILKNMKHIDGGTFEEWKEQGIAINKGIIQVRRGLKDDLQIDKLLPGELAIATDAPCMWFCWAVGEVEQIPTSDNIEEVIAEIIEKYLKENPVTGISEIYMRVYEGYIQYSSDGETYNDLISVSELKGAKGDPGSAGVGIRTIKQTTKSSEDGGTNVITITLSNDTKVTFEVLNGQKGSPGNPGNPGNPGVGIQSISQQTGNLNGGKNTIQIVLTNGNVQEVFTYNGKNGSDANVTLANIVKALGFTPASEEFVNNQVSTIPKFELEAVDSLPTANIKETTVYLLKSGNEIDNLYTEYIYKNGKWEKLGSQTLDLSKYAEKSTTLKGYGITDGATKEEVSRLSQEIAELQNGNNISIPDYWDEHLTEKITTIKELQSIGGRDCFSFVLLADTHYPANLGKCSPLLARKIMNACNIKYVLHVGDAQTRACLSTKEEILAENELIRAMFKPIEDNMLFTEGNHDGSYATVNGVSYTKQLNEAEMFEEYYRKNGLDNNVHFSDDCNAYYVDDVTNKVRYIGLNAQSVPNTVNDINDDGTAKYPKFREVKFMQNQFDFLVNEALIDGITDKWAIVIFAHIGIWKDDGGDYSLMVDLLSAYQNKTTYTGEYVGTLGGENIAGFTNLFNAQGEGAGYAYINDSGEFKESFDGTQFVTNYIPVTFNKTTPDILRLSEANTLSGLYVQCYNSNKEVIGTARSYCFDNNNTQSFVIDNDGVMTWKAGEFSGYMSTTNYGALAYVRFYLYDVDGIDMDKIAITVNEDIVYTSGGDKSDSVSINADFTTAKGTLIGYFAGHNHLDTVQTPTNTLKVITTRCDAKEENDATLKEERVVGTITEQSFDVFTVNKKTRTVNVTKIGAGSDRSFTY